MLQLLSILNTASEHSLPSVLRCLFDWYDRQNPMDEAGNCLYRRGNKIKGWDNDWQLLVNSDTVCQSSFSRCILCFFLNFQLKPMTVACWMCWAEALCFDCCHIVSSHVSASNYCLLTTELSVMSVGSRCPGSAGGWSFWLSFFTLSEEPLMMFSTHVFIAWSYAGRCSIC